LWLQKEDTDLIKNSFVRIRIDAPTKNEIRVIGNFVLFERRELSERDRLHAMRMIEEPPVPNIKLMAAANALPKQS
jgi:hypothetical protein